MFCLPQSFPKMKLQVPVSKLKKDKEDYLPTIFPRTQQAKEGKTEMCNQLIEIIVTVVFKLLLL